MAHRQRPITTNASIKAAIQNAGLRDLGRQAPPAPPLTVAAPPAPTPAPEPDQDDERALLESLTKDELYAEATRLDIPGRSSMSRDDLIAAIEIASV